MSWLSDKKITKTFISKFLLDSLFTWKFFMFLSSADFFKINFFEKIFQEYHQSVKQFGSRSGPTFFRA